MIQMVTFAFTRGRARKISDATIVPVKDGGAHVAKAGSLLRFKGFFHKKQAYSEEHGADDSAGQRFQR